MFTRPEVFDVGIEVTFLTTGVRLLLHKPINYVYLKGEKKRTV